MPETTEERHRKLLLKLEAYCEKYNIGKESVRAKQKLEELKEGEMRKNKNKKLF